MKRILCILFTLVCLISASSCSVILDGAIEGAKEGLQGTDTSDIILESSDTDTGAVFVGSIETIKENFAKYSDLNLPELRETDSEDGKHTYSILPFDINVENVNIFIYETADGHIERIAAMAAGTVTKESANVALEYCGAMVQALGAPSGPKAISELVKKQKEDSGSTYGCTEDHAGFMLQATYEGDSITFLYFGASAMKGEKSDIKKYK